MYIYENNTSGLLDQGLHGPKAQPRAELPRQSKQTATWSDWLDQNHSPGVRVYEPKSVDDVVGAVKSENKLRTIGARHADNRIGRPNAGAAMIDPKRLSGVSLVKKIPGGALVSIGAGTRVEDANTRLWNMELALPNMGSFDQQYFAGAVGTGTHGSGASLEPFADLLRAVDLVDGTGQPWRIEDPAQPLTTKAAFAKSNSGWKLAQDDMALWRSVGVHAGALGSVTGMVLKVLDRYKLWEIRQASTYEDLPQTPEEWNKTLKSARHWEALICPYPENGKHFAVITRRDKATLDLRDSPVPEYTNDPDKLPANSRHFMHELQRIQRRLAIKALPIGEILVQNPDDVGNHLRSGMKRLVPQKPAEKRQPPYDFVDRSYRILLLGIGARAHGYEMAIPLENVNNVVGVILSVAADWNHPEKDKHQRCVFTSPFSLRFVQGGPQFIGTNGRERVGAPASNIWCFIEIPRLFIHDEKEKKREYPNYPDAAVQAIWQACRQYGVRAHWGQQEFLIASDLPKLYPNLAAWKAQASRLDPDGKFANKRALEIGLR